MWFSLYWHWYMDVYVNVNMFMLCYCYCYCYWTLSMLAGHGDWNKNRDSKLEKPWMWIFGIGISSRLSSSIFPSLSTKKDKKKKNINRKPLSFKLSIWKHPLRFFVSIPLWPKLVLDIYDWHYYLDAYTYLLSMLIHPIGLLRVQLLSTELL